MKKNIVININLEQTISVRELKLPAQDAHVPPVFVVLKHRMQSCCEPTQFCCEPTSVKINGRAKYSLTFDQRYGFFENAMLDARL